METFAFEPLYGPVSGSAGGALLPSVTVAGTAAAVASTGFSGSTNNAQRQIRVSNTAAVWAYVNFGILGSVVAATVAASLPIAPGAVEVFTVANEVNAASVILASGTGNVIFTRGVGL